MGPTCQCPNAYLPPSLLPWGISSSTFRAATAACFSRGLTELAAAGGPPSCTPSAPWCGCTGKAAEEAAACHSRAAEGHHTAPRAPPAVARTQAGDGLLPEMRTGPARPRPAARAPRQDCSAAALHPPASQPCTAAAPRHHRRLRRAATTCRWSDQLTPWNSGSSSPPSTRPAVATLLPPSAVKPST